MNLRVTLVFVLGLASAAPPCAAAEPAPRLRLADVVEEARRRNPEIQAARDRARAADSVPRRVTGYDDPTFSWEAWNTPESFRIDRADNNILRLSQRIPFPGKRTLAGRMAERDADMAHRETDAVELDVIAAVKRAYYDLWRLHQDLLIYAREKALAERFAHIAEQKYGVGQVPQPDVLRAQVELTRGINRVTTTELTIDAARAELNALLSRPPEDPLGEPEHPSPPRLDEDVVTLTRRALESRPELAAQRAAVAREETSVHLARRNYLPDFELGVARFLNSGRSDGFGAMASVSIPLVYKGKYDAAAGEANARLASAQAELRRVEDRVRREVQQAFIRARTAQLQYDLFVTTHIPQAEQTLRVTESAYQSGAVDFLALLDSLRAIESVHIEHIDAAADFERARADLERAVGGPLALPASPAPHQESSHE
jgi:cobalt-zinc-cadmium efflux system outer membrane protein